MPERRHYAVPKKKVADGKNMVQTVKSVLRIPICTMNLSDACQADKPDNSPSPSDSTFSQNSSSNQTAPSYKETLLSLYSTAFPASCNDLSPKPPDCR
jgi:hypothetical protein